jgi:hypothetical protein
MLSKTASECDVLLMNTSSPSFQDYALAQGISQPFIAENTIRYQASSCGIYGGRLDTGTGFLEVLRFSPVSITPLMLRTYLPIAEAVIS